MSKNEYNPDYVSPPSDTVKEVLDRLGYDTDDENDVLPELWAILQGAPITPATAMLLDELTEVPYSFWANRQMNYSKWLTEQAADNT